MATPDNAVDHLNDTALPKRESAYALGRPSSTMQSESSPAERDQDLSQHPTVRIRPYSIGDFSTLLRFPGVLRLDVPDSLVLPRSGMITLQAALPGFRKDRPTFVAVADGQCVGFVRFSPRRPDGRWIISAIGASTGVYAPEPVWEALLAHGVRAAGLRGVRRLFARVPVGHALLDAMRQSGWIPYARETVFRAERLSSVTRGARDLRLQEPADTWAIHQLYAASRTPAVQEIEALTSHFWHMDQRTRHLARCGKPLDPRRDGGLAAYARLYAWLPCWHDRCGGSTGKGRRLGALLDGVIAVPQYEDVHDQFIVRCGRISWTWKGELTDGDSRKSGSRSC
jgi:hypothetical protein